MCAVFGILGDYDPALARTALARMVHRGPDYCGIEECPGLFFAHNRLSIIDLDPRAHQPMRRGSALLSFNGEIYNFKVLRDELGGQFATQSDAEVLLAAYERWGTDFVQRLVGMFAIAIYDDGTLYLFRDRLGKKPLFYLQTDKQFVFASEIKALTPFLKQVRMNDDALMSYLSFLAPTPPHTFYEGIRKLEAGEMLVFRDNTVQTRRYYDLLDAPPHRYRDKPEALDAIREALDRALDLRLNADVPMAALLSGGIDSALLAALVKTRGRSLTTFTLGYDAYANYDERANARATANALGVENIAVEISQNDFIDATERVFATLDEPLNDPAAVPLYLLFEAIKTHGFKVVFSGEGSDELFLGYRQYFEFLDIEHAAQLQQKNWLKKYFRANFSMSREWERYKRAFDDSLVFRTSGERLTDLQKNILMRRNVRDDDALRFLAPYRDRFESSPHDDPGLWYSYIDLHLFQAEHFLAKLDRVSMAHGIESRTPYLDHTLAETLFSTAPELRYRDGVTKGLLKKIAAPYLPPEVLTRKKKGFASPYMEWLIASGRLETIMRVNEQTGLFKKEVLEKYMEMGRRGRFKQHVWGLYVLSCWIERELL